MAQEAPPGKERTPRIIRSELNCLDYSLNNPDTLTKYKTAAQISNKVLDAVTGWCQEGTKILEICQKGDALLNEEVSKVYKGKKISKGLSHPTTVSPDSFVTPYTPLVSDVEEAATVLKPNEIVKIQLGAQIDGFGTIVCNSIAVPSKQQRDGADASREADLLLANYWANELLLRLMVPPGLLASNADEEKVKAQAEKAPTQAKITQLLEKVVKSYKCNLVESTTSWLFERNEIEGKKKIILAPAEGVKGEGTPEVGEVWGVEMGVSRGSGKCKTLPNRPTLHRRTTTTYQLKRPTSRAILSEVVGEFKTFPFSLRQLKDERDAKAGVIEGVRSGVLRQYEVVGDKDNESVARLLSTVAITKNGLTLLAAPPKPDLAQFKTENKIQDEEVLKILERPLNRNTGSKGKNKKKKRKSAKKATPEEDDDESSDEE
ncbi:MAG: Curved DNA-binding protein (42 kDa protein) [Chrysothrix sp. TS-e1954]|nr:MAG: Curved DNA-binding protein (42 kDa protein) [Chrysothrix sp. TS-e1954]